MAVTKKGKRKLVYDDEIYFWHLVDDGYLGGQDIQIISKNKNLILSFTLLQNSQIVIQKDEYFSGWSRIDFSLDNVESITPSSIVQILSCYKKEIENNKSKNS